MKPKYCHHYPVLLDEVITLLNIKPDGVFADCTMGYGGHSQAVLRKLSDKATYVGIDKDDFAISESSKWSAAYSLNKFIIKDDFKNFKYISEKLNIASYDGILVDMGVSSVQLDDEQRGFSYHKDGYLDMRMDRTSTLSAWDVVNTFEEKELSKIIYSYGEERHAKRIARAICETRRDSNINTTLKLAEIIKQAYPQKERYAGKHPARKTFQAIRIYVNDELEGMSQTVEDMAALLSHGGVLAIITFHSLEDRIIKDAFTSLARGCTCPRDFPVCVCGAKQEFKILTKKPITPSDEELELNLRSRSAKLRALKRIGH